MALAVSVLACESDDIGLGPPPEPDYLAGRTSFIVELIDHQVWPGAIIRYRLLNGTAEPVMYLAAHCYGGALEHWVGAEWVEERGPNYGCVRDPPSLAPGKVTLMQHWLPPSLAPGEYRIRQWILSESTGHAFVRSAPFLVVDSSVAP